MAHAKPQRKTARPGLGSLQAIVCWLAHKPTNALRPHEFLKSQKNVNVLFALCGFAALREIFAVC
jgi:hypothetical protein